MAASDEFRARLARLRREVPGASVRLDAAGASALDQARPAGPLPAWFLARLGAPRSGADPDAGIGNCSTRLGDPLELTQKVGPRGAYFVRECRLPLAHTHGSYQLHEAFAAQPQAFECLTRGRTRDFPGAQRALFLDIETTGLSGGAGTQVFLIGLGWFEEGGFVLWQGFLREPSEECALLAAVDERIRGKQALVSFFGKAFDRHRIEDRMRVQRLDAPFEGRAHLDLYFAARSVYAGAFSDLRLATLERELAGLARQDDLSGAFAPAAWMDYLAGRPHRLDGVLQHNRDDVLSLVTLYAHLGRLLVDARADGRVLEPLGTVGATRALALARLELKRGQAHRALDWHTRSLALCGEIASSRAALMARAQALARAGKLHEALELSLELGNAQRDGSAALCLARAARLAKQVGDGRQAELARRALELGRTHLAGNARARLESRLKLLCKGPA